MIYDDDELQFHGGDHEGVCGGHGGQSYEEKQKKQYDEAMGRLCCVSWVSIFVIACQLTGGILAGSIAIMCDTAHLASDMIGFIIGIVALRMSMKKASSELTYGWQRSEVIGTVFSVIFLITITIWLLKEAIGRVFEPVEIDADMMLFTAVIGLIFNLIQMQILHDDGHDHGHGGHDHGHDHGNLNVDQAYLHALSDMLNSVGVCIAATIIYFFPQAKVADPICAFVFAILVVIQCKPILGKCITVLMEGAPDEIDQVALIEAIKKIDEDVSVHDFHLWSISQGSIALSCHIHCRNTNQVLKEATRICKEDFGIDHITIQAEDIDDDQNKLDCHQATHATYET